MMKCSHRLAVAAFTTLVTLVTIPNAAAESHSNKLSASEGRVIFRTHPNFLSFAIDSSHLERGFDTLKLSDPTFISLAKHLSPAYLRVGGIGADRLLFSRDPTVGASNSTSYFTGTEWLALHKFAHQTNSRLLFDLNVLHRKVTDADVPKQSHGIQKHPGGSAETEWDASNAADLINFCAEYGLHNDWQLGNEPNSYLHNFNLSVSPEQLARDFQTLKNVLNESPFHDRSLLIGPDVTRPITNHRERQSDLKRTRTYPNSTQGSYQADGLGNQVSSTYPVRTEDAERDHLNANKYLDQFLASGGRDAISGVGFHQYYLSRTANISAYLSPATFDLLRYQVSVVKTIVDKNYENHVEQPPIWMSETGSCVGGGVAGITDTFAASFLWVDKLGLAARLGVSVVVRQSLHFGNYSLIDHDTLTPNPDWWLSVLYKRLVDPRVLDIFVPLSRPTLRLYTHCSPSHNITVFGINSGSYRERLYFNEECIVNFYAVKTASDDIRTKEILLNEVPLRLNPDGSLPKLNPERYHALHGRHITIQPYTVLFMEIVLDTDHACKQNRHV